MDFVFVINVAFSILLISIPFWPKKYLRYGIYIPILLGLSWILFHGCPLVPFQQTRTTPSKEMIKFFYPTIDKIQLVRLNYFGLMLILFFSLYKLYS